MDILTAEHASIRQNVKHGYILFWQSQYWSKDKRFGSVVSWQIYPTKKIANDIIKLVCILAYVNSLEFEYTIYNTKVTKWQERDRIQILLYTEDQTLMDYTDQDVYDLIEDGFIDISKLHESMLSYYRYLNS